MSWDKILGHEQIVSQFRQRLARGKLGSSFLFIGPAGIGKRTLAHELARGLLCDRGGINSLDACDICPACQQTSAGSHPDLELISKPPDKSYIPIDLLIGDREHRMSDGLCYRISMKPYGGLRKVAIIDDADHLNIEGANCLLKTLEEPPPRSVLILIGTSQQKQLPTIRSRCQIIRFQPLSNGHVAQLLLDKEIVNDTAKASEVSRDAKGSLATAIELLDESLLEFRQFFLSQLTEVDQLAHTLGKEVTDFVAQAGKEASARRNRLRQVVGFATEYFRQKVRHECDAGKTSNLRAIELWTDCIDRCVDTESQIHNNANQATLVDCWLDDLLTLQRSSL
ncbi:MAG: hypothetical protein MK165_11100 [Pirellulaceae bacterium]|nr:hypothetical protein [Pirellulaceae bacterium]